jgi:putative FmdB family regulatory protein
MPVYKYKCTDSECKSTFELLVNMDQRDSQKCTFCQKDAVRDGFEGFSVNTPLDLKNKSAHTKKEIDKVVGADASKKWEAFEKKTAKKLEGANIIEVDVKPGEKFNSEALLGSKERQEKVKMHAEVMQKDKSAMLAAGKNPNDWDKTGYKQVNL